MNPADPVNGKPIFPITYYTGPIEQVKKHQKRETFKVFQKHGVCPKAVDKAIDQGNTWKINDKDWAIFLIENIIQDCYPDKKPEELRSHIGDIAVRSGHRIPGRFVSKYINDKIKYTT